MNKFWDIIGGINFVLFPVVWWFAIEVMSWMM